jgi:CRP-like cAMP-binding protein
MAPRRGLTEARPAPRDDAKDSSSLRIEGFACSVRMEATMASTMKPPEIVELDALALKFKSLELDSEEDLQTVLKLVRPREAVNAGEDIVDMRSPPRQLTVLLTGVACLHKRLEDDSRQIYTFQYSGDFCDLHRYMLPELDQTATVTALTGCSVGTIRHDDLDQMLSQRPKLSLAFWRASVLEASILRERLLNVSRRSALPRVASIICEQLARLEAINIKSAVVPLTQVDLADAAGLSAVHVNRIVQDLRKLGALSKKRRILEVASRDRLLQLANFDRTYLNMPDLLSTWSIELAEG